jgi:hypothetical protein
MTDAVPHWEFHEVPDAASGLEAAYQGRYFELLGLNNPRLNSQLEVHAEEAGHQDGWYAVLLLTPWMALRAFLPDDPRNPRSLVAAEELEVDSDGRVVVGSEVTLPVAGIRRTLEVAYDPRVGHHLVEMLAQDMRDFADGDQALAWLRRAAAARDSGEAEAAPSRPAERRVSRRDLFRGLLGRRS